MPEESRAEVAARLGAAGCVFAEAEADVLLSSTDDPAVLSGMIERRASGVPLEQVVGWADFCGIRLVVAEGIFVPRQRSALLVESAAEVLSGGRTGNKRPRTATAGTAAPDATTPGAAGPRWADSPAAGPIVVDLCCGCGAIGAALAARVPGIRLHAADLDPAAVRCARVNLANLAAEASLYEGDLFAALPVGLRGRVSVLVANVPYVPTSELRLLPREARKHEPRLALDGGPDGLVVLRRVAAQAWRWLVPGGAVLMETSQAQARRAAHELTRRGLHTRVASDAERGATVVIGRRAAADTPGPDRR